MRKRKRYEKKGEQARVGGGKGGECVMDKARDCKRETIRQQMTAELCEGFWWLRMREEKKHLPFRKSNAEE